MVDVKNADLLVFILIKDTFFCYVLKPLRFMVICVNFTLKYNFKFYKLLLSFSRFLRQKQTLKPEFVYEIAIFIKFVEETLKLKCNGVHKK